MAVHCKPTCEVIQCVLVFLFLSCTVYANYSLWPLHDMVMEKQRTLHTVLTMANDRQKMNQSICHSNNTSENLDICSMVDVANGILDRFPDNKIAYRLVRFSSFLYGFTLR
jgi:hypothetical protein